MHTRTKHASGALRLAALAAFAAALNAGSSAAWESAPTRSNVLWIVDDSLTTCPAGDSVAAGHGARLRAVVRYLDGSGAPRVAVLPESLSLRLSPIAAPGGPVIHDERVLGGSMRAFAEDSTDAAGDARFTVPSLSGSGRIAIEFLVSGESAGADTITVRGCDADLDGRVGGADAVVDLDYSGAADAADAALRSPHADHWRRSALHGALVRRTSLCGTCPYEAENTLGESGAGWSPDGRELAFTRFTGAAADCAVHIVASDPADGDAIRQFTFPPTGVHDYDPDFSPFGTEIVFDRGDRAIWRKGIPGVNADTALHLVTMSDDGTPQHRGDVTPAISPDGRWVAFSRKGTDGFWHLWKIRIEGTSGGATAIQLTNNPAGYDQYPRWSPDGAWIYYDRQNGFDGRRRVYRVSANGGAEDSLLAPAGTNDATTPDVSPDGAIVLAGGGPAGFAWTRAIEAALPPQTSFARSVLNYGTHRLWEPFPLLSPRLSPDGTRLVVRASPPDHPNELPQIWASRRSMNLPPSITALRGQPIVDATPYVDITAHVGVLLTIPVAATDPEGDPLANGAYFLRPDLGMSFDPGLGWLTWTPPPSADDSTYVVRFRVTTASGGTDYALARIHVTSDPASVEPTSARFALHRNQPNPFTVRTTIGFELPTVARVRLEVLDTQGRRIALLIDGSCAAGRHAVPWAASGANGGPLPPGVYVCRLSAGERFAQQKLLLVR